MKIAVMRRDRQAPSLIVVLVCLLLGAAACGSPSGQSSTAPSTSPSSSPSGTALVTGETSHLTATDPGVTTPQGIVSANVEGGHGIVDPTGVFYAYGKSVTFVFTPDPGYHVGSVSLDGDLVTLTHKDRFTFVCTAASQSLLVSFARDGEATSSATITP
jgi:hypothetical protein